MEEQGNYILQIYDATIDEFYSPTMPNMTHSINNNHIKESSILWVEKHVKKMEWEKKTLPKEIKAKEIMEDFSMLAKINSLLIHLISQVIDEYRPNIDFNRESGYRLVLQLAISMAILRTFLIP